MMATSILLGVEARLAKTDAMLLFCVVAAMGRWRAFISTGSKAGRRQRPLLLPLIFWSALALGVLLKGPLILMFVGLTIADLVHPRSLGMRWMAG